MGIDSSEAFILKNRNLPVDELAAQTGIRPRQIRKILDSTIPRPVPYHDPPVDKKLLVALSIAILLLAFASYLPLFHNQFVNWDDPESIQGNTYLHRFNFKWMWTTFLLGNWIPLNWFSLTLDYQLGGLNPWVYHIHNLLLHALNSIWVFFITLRVLGLARPSNGAKPFSPLAPLSAFLTALLFAVLPLHVESVAWATERKDVLCGFFFLACLWVYLGYGASEVRSRRGFLAAFILFILALLSKPMAITMPAVLLILDFWPLGRLKSEKLSSLLVEKVPFFAVSLLSALVTVMAQAHAKAVWSSAKLPFDFRIANACHSIVLYALKTLSPLGLSTFYPLPTAPRAWTITNIVSIALVVALTVLAYRCRKSWPFITAAWLFYVVTLLPVLGIIQVGGQAAADRYAYLPSLSLLMLLALVISKLLEDKPKWIACACVVLGIGMGHATYRQASLWKDSVTLWENVVSRQSEDSCVARSNLANAYQNAGRSDDALREYDQAISIDPSSATPHDGKGTVLASKGLNEAAETEFKTAIALDPSRDVSHFSLWILYDRMGRRDDSAHEMQEASRLRPSNPTYDNFLGISYGNQGRTDLAIQSFQKALAKDPGNPDFLANLATTYQRTGQYDQAVSFYTRAIAVNPTNATYRLNLGNTYMLMGMNQEAIAALHQAEILQPGEKSILQKNGEAYKKSGNPDKAAEYFNRAGSNH